MYSSNGGDAHRSTSSSSSFSSSSSSSSSSAWSKHVSANSAWENNRQGSGYGSRDKFERSDNRDRFFLKKDWNLNVDNRSSTTSPSTTSTSSISASGSYRSSNGLPGPATKRRAIGRHGPIVENGRYVTTAACRSTLDSSFSALRTPLESKAERDGYGSPVTERPNNKDIGLDGQHHHFLSPSEMRPPPPPYNNTQRFDPNSRYDSSHSSHRLNYVNNTSNNESYHRGSYVNNANGVDGRERSKINGFPYAWDPAHRDRDRDNRAWNRPDSYHRRTCSLSKLDSPLREWGALDRDLGESRIDRYGREPTFLDDRDHSYGDWEVRERSHQPKSFPSFADSLPISSTSHLRDDVAAINITSHPKDQVVATFNNISFPREEVVATMNKGSHLREEVAIINNTSHLREEVAVISNTPYLREEVAKTVPSDPKAVSTSIASPHRLPLSPLKSPFVHDSSNKRGNNGEIDSQKKRPRLTWGQGLAKYEKEKTEEDPLVSRKQQEGIQQECSINDIEFLTVDASDCLPMSRNITCEGECLTQKKNIDHNFHPIQEEQINAGLSQRDSKDNLLDDVIIPSIKRESVERILTDQIESSIANVPFGCEISVAPNVQPSVLHDVKVFLENYQRERPNVSKEFLTQHVEIVEYEIDLIEKEISKLDCEEAAQHSRIINTDQGVSSSSLDEADRYVSMNQTEDMKQKYDQDSEKKFGESTSVCERELPIEAVDLVMDEIINQVVSLSHVQIVDKKVGNCEHGMPINMDGHGDLIYSLLSSNKEIAKGCWSALTHLNSPLMEVILQGGRLYDCPQKASMWRLNAESHEKKKVLLQSKVCEEKRSTKFVEKVLAIKYRTWREAWKQEQVSKSLRKDGGDKTPHPSILSVLNQQSVARPYGAIVSSLPNPWIESEREYLRMPSMLLAKKVRSLPSFETKNALVEDPITAEKERKVMNPWSAEERKTFLEKYALLGKDFRKIASFLKYKSVADCIEFYYRNQKVEEFQKIHRRHQLKKRRDSRASGLYLATTTSASTRHREANRACMEGLTLVAAAAAAISAPKSTALNSSTISTKGCRDRYSGRPRNSTTMPPVKGCNKEQGVKGPHLNGRQQQLRLSQEESDSHWTDGERLLFMEALAMFGKDFNSICLHVGTKNTRQCKSFFSKARSRLGLDQVVERHKTVTQSPSENCEASTDMTVDMKPQIFEDIKPQHLGLDQAGRSHKMVIQSTRENCKASMNITVDMKPQVFDDIKTKTFKNIKPHNSEGVKCQEMENVKLQMIEDIKVELAVENCKYDFLKQNMVNTTVMDASSSGFITELQSRISEEAHSDPQAAGMVNALNSPEDVGDAKGAHTTLNPVFGAMSENLNEVASSDGGGEDSLTTGSLHHGEVIEKLLVDRVEDNLIATGLTGGKTQQLVHENVEDISTLNVDNEGSPSTPFGCNLKAMRLLQKETVPASKNPNPKEVKTRREPTSWTQEEKTKFNDVLKVHGRNWDRLQESLPSKSLTQIKTYFQNSKAKLGLGSGSEGSLHGSGKVAIPRKRKIDDSDSSNNQGSGGQSPLSRASGQSDCSSFIATPNILPASGGGTGSNMLNAESMAHVSFIARSAQKEDSPNNQKMAFNPAVALNSLFNPGIFASPNTQHSQPSSTDLVPPPQVTIAPAAIQEQGIVGRMTQDVSLPIVQLLHTPTVVQTTKQKPAILEAQAADSKKMQPQLVQRPQQLRLQPPFRNHQQASNPVLANSSIHEAIRSSQHADLPLGKPQVIPKLQQSAQIQQLQQLQCHQQQQQLLQPQIYEVQNLTQHGSVPLANAQQQHIVKGLYQLPSPSSNSVETPLIKQCDAGGFHAIARIQKAEPAEDLRNELSAHSTGKSQANGDVKLFGQSLLSQPAINNQQNCQQLNSKVCSVPYTEGALSTCPISFITENGVMDNNVASHLSASGDVYKQGLLPLKQQIVCPNASSVKCTNALLQRPNLCNEADRCAFQAVAPINDNLIGATQINDNRQPTDSVSVSQFMASAISDQNSSANILPKLTAQPSDPKAFSRELEISEHGSKRCDQILGCERQGIEVKKTRAQDLCLTDGVEAVPSHGLPRVLSALVALAEWRLQNANGGNSERLTDEFLTQSWEALQRDPGALVEAGKARGVFSHLNSVKLEESGMADALRNVDGNMGGGAGV